MRFLSAFLTSSISLLLLGGTLKTLMAQSTVYDQGHIDQFCAENAEEPQPGVQFDGEEASPTVMQLAPGRYEYPTEGALILFPNNHFLLRLPTNTNEMVATDAQDLLVPREGILGGCSAEHLSEVVVKNDIDVNSLELVAPYTN